MYFLDQLSGHLRNLRHAQSQYYDWLATAAEHRGCHSVTLFEVPLAVDQTRYVQLKIKLGI